MNNLIYTEKDFLNLFTLPKISFSDFCQKIKVLDISDRSGTFKIKQSLDDFIDRVAKKDNRKNRLPIFKEKLYKILVTDADNTLKYWFRKQGSLPESIEYYFNIPNTSILSNGIFSGRTNSKYGRICKNINFENYYNTKKCYTNDSEYVFGLLKSMFEDFKLRNSLVGPAFFDQICRYDGDPGLFLQSFMVGANRPSTFNPATYKGILDSIFDGKTLFAPVMGWNAYQVGFYSSKFNKFISTDVIPKVVENGNLLHKEYLKYQNQSLFEIDNKEVDLYLCPSEKLDSEFNFSEKYHDQVDAVLLSPPYFDLEIYNSENQSFTTFPKYEDWLIGYWEETVKLCKTVMRSGAKFGFVISNYRNADKKMTTISNDMREVVQRHLNQIGHYRVQWSAIAGSRQSKKTKDGNFEDLWLFKK